MSLNRRRSWIKNISVCGVGLLLSGMTTIESVQPKVPTIQGAHGIHLEGRFDASCHGVVEELSFSDAASF